MKPSRDQIAAFLREQTEADNCGGSNEYAAGYRRMAEIMVSNLPGLSGDVSIVPDLARGGADMLTHLAHFAETGLRPDDAAPPTGATP